jgi:hypothetical protein
VSYHGQPIHRLLAEDQQSIEFFGHHLPQDALLAFGEFVEAEVNMRNLVHRFPSPAAFVSAAARAGATIDGRFVEAIATRH